MDLQKEDVPESTFILADRTDAGFLFQTDVVWSPYPAHQMNWSGLCDMLSEQQLSQPLGFDQRAGLQGMFRRGARIFHALPMAGLMCKRTAAILKLLTRKKKAQYLRLPMTSQSSRCQRLLKPSIPTSEASKRKSEAPLKLRTSAKRQHSHEATTGG
ncbi:unnamed protein product [Symbiodinium sp. CCMP2592]|nr:unnamed protein product [Symbiodinium sp. CCMP2592]